MIEKISKSERKRLFKQVEQLASELAELSDNDLKKFPGQQDIRDEIIGCRRLKGGARKRQIKYLAKVLRQYELDEIYAYMDARKGSSLKESRILHRAERLRDIIINEAMGLQEECRGKQIPFEPDYPGELVAEVLQELPELDEADMRRCAYQYVRTRNRTHFRELYRMVRAAIEMQERRAESG